MQPLVSVCPVHIPECERNFYGSFESELILLLTYIEDSEKYSGWRVGRLACDKGSQCASGRLLQTSRIRCISLAAFRSGRYSSRSRCLHGRNENNRAIYIPTCSGFVWFFSPGGNEKFAFSRSRIAMLREKFHHHLVSTYAFCAQQHSNFSEQMDCENAGRKLTSSLEVGNEMYPPSYILANNANSICCSDPGEVRWNKIRTRVETRKSLQWHLRYILCHQCFELGHTVNAIR